MTAPKVIWASAELWTDETWLAGEWDINSHALDGEHARDRSETFPGLAAACAAQWGGHATTQQEAKNG